MTASTHPPYLIGIRPVVSVVILSMSERWDTFLPHAMASVRAQTLRPRPQVIVQSAEAYWGDKLNDALRATRGDMLAHLCDDDTWSPTFLERVLDTWDTRYQLTYSNVEGIGEAVPTVWRALPLVRESFQGTVACPIPVSYAYTRKLFNRVGGFDPSLLYFDWDFAYRACLAGAVGVHIDEALFQYRTHAGQGSNHMSHRDAMMAFFKKHPELWATVGEAYRTGTLKRENATPVATPAVHHTTGAL